MMLQYVSERLLLLWDYYFAGSVNICDCLCQKYWVLKVDYDFSFPLLVTAWKVSKYAVIAGLYFLAFGLNTGKYGLK